MRTSHLLAIFLLPLCTHASPGGDTTINGVKVNFEYALNIFPESWRTSPINAWGDPIPSGEIVRSEAIMVKALNKYPLTVLKKELTSIYFLRSMKFYDVSYGGTNSTDAVYITNNGIAVGYTEFYLEQTFHHEFSSILFRNHVEFLDTSDWKRNNLASFDYNDPENGVGSIRNNQSSQDLDSVLCEKGFLTQYAMSSMENDINTFAQNIFCPTAEFRRVMEKYPRINKKVKLLIAFYNKINPAFTEDFFKKLKNQS
ncbi:MAG: hypothetical protein WDN26_11965 [Chitinophagaceae bacterium]